jgi:hypothetical protein
MGASVIPATSGTASDNWVSISSVTPTNGASTVSFTSISGYKKLMLRVNGISNSALLTFNSDTSANYAYSNLQYNGSSFSGAVAGADTSVALSGGSATSIVLTVNEANTSGLKNFNGFSTGFTGVTIAKPILQGAYYGTAAITTVTLTTVSGTYTATGTVTLYGVAA